MLAGLHTIRINGVLSRSAPGLDRRVFRRLATAWRKTTGNWLARRDHRMAHPQRPEDFNPSNPSRDTAMRPSFMQLAATSPADPRRRISGTVGLDSMATDGQFRVRSGLARGTARHVRQRVSVHFVRLARPGTIAAHAMPRHDSTERIASSIASSRQARPRSTLATLDGAATCDVRFDRGCYWRQRVRHLVRRVCIPDGEQRGHGKSAVKLVR